jgi:hypothetical protein
MQKSDFAYSVSPVIDTQPRLGWRRRAVLFMGIARAQVFFLCRIQGN